jgi:hypothetical protein
MVLEETVITKEDTELFAKYMDRTPGKGLFEDCSDSVIIFARHMLGIKLYSWQIKIALDIMESIKDDTKPREFVVLTSRQIGKTTLAAILALWIAIFNKLKSGEEANSTAGIISASDLQAKLVLREIKKYIHIGDTYCRIHYSREKDDLMDKGVLSAMINESEDNNKQTLSFKAEKLVKDPDTGILVPEYGDYLLKGSKIGTRLNSYPPTTSVLGQTFAYLHEDEAGRTDRFTDEAHLEYLHPTGDARNAIRLYTSTPWVTSGFFYELADPDDIKDEHNYNRYLFTIDAIQFENPKQYESVMKTVAEMRLDGKKDEVDRAYYCRFTKGEMSFFDPEDVDVMFKDDIKSFDSYLGKCDIGVDFGGQVKSRTVITISTMIENKIIRLYHKVYNVGEDNNLMNDLCEIMLKFPNWDRIIPDECPQGDYMIRDMRTRGWNVHPMNFRTWKTKKYGAFRSKLKKHQISSYKDDVLKVEMKALELQNTVLQSNIMAPRGYTDDLIDSFVMSSFFYLEDAGKIKFFTEDGVFGSEKK